MAHTDRVVLAAATLNRKYYLDVNTGTYAVPTWVPVNGMTDFVAKVDPALADDSDFYSGWKSQAKTALGWNITTKLVRKVTVASATAYDPGQEALRTASLAFGNTGIVDVRFYEVTTSGPKVEAYRGYAEVTWASDGGAMDALDTVSVTLTGRGELSAITHPDGAPSAVPVVTSINPTTGVQAGGYLVSIMGTGFTGTVETTGVKFGVTNATSWQVISNNLIVAIAPAKAAGPFEIVVTNASGASSSGPSITVS